MEKKKDVRNVLMVALVFAIMVMAVGYAALAQRLTVNGKATIGDAKWKVRITDISFDETASNISTSASTQSLDPAEAAVGEGSTGAKFDVTLGAPGDKAVYNITVTNLGTIEAELKEMMPLEENRPSVLLMSVPDLKEHYYRDIEEEFKSYALQLLEDL